MEKNTPEYEEKHYSYLHKLNPDNPNATYEDLIQVRNKLKIALKGKEGERTIADLQEQLDYVKGKIEYWVKDKTKKK